MSRVFWLHDEGLTQPQALGATDRWVYFWDLAYFDNQAWSLKRQVFIYETLCELAQQGCEVYQGDTIEGLVALRQSGFELVTQTPQDPVLRGLVDILVQRVPDLVLKSAPRLVDSSKPLAPKRFFHYWKKVEKTLLGEVQPTTHHRVR